jgi:hypothetical protein
MGLTILGDILSDWSKYELEDSIYVSKGTQPTLEGPARVIPFESELERDVEHEKYFLGIEQVRDVVEGLEAQLGRIATPQERLRAAVHYALNDAFIDPRDAVDI